MRTYLDTETCGFHGPIVLVQLAHGDGEVQMHHVWHMSIKDVRDLLASLCDHNIVGFNLAFDWFHVCQMYTVVDALSRIVDPNTKLIDVMETYSLIEADCRLGPCLKPQNALDLMLHARKGPYQAMMDREEIRIKRVPAMLAAPLAERLGRDIPLKDLYFARKQNPKERWKIYFVKDDLGQVIEDVRDLVLSFAPKSSLKALAADALGLEETDTFEDLGAPAGPENEEGYAPFYRPGSPNQWPDVIRKHINHWANNERAQKYAINDIIYTRGLDKHFDYPELGDDDSILACMVGAVRWRGYKLDIPRLRALYAKSLQECSTPEAAHYNSTSWVREHLQEVLSPTERSVMLVNGKTTTKGIVLEEIAKWKVSVPCTKCAGAGCQGCKEGLVNTDEPHPAAIRAQAILNHRHALKEVELFEKLLLAGRFHVSVNVIGALSGRMSGADGLNPQGIKRAKEVRACFPLADEGFQLDGGDFSGFEVCLADAVYGDPDLRKDLLTLRPCKKCAKWAAKNSKSAGTANSTCDECKGTGQEGTKIHALFGQYLFPPNDYDQIYDTKGAKNPANDLYSRSKQGVFALLYGGEEHTLSTRVGVDPTVAEQAYQRWVQRYKVWGEARKQIFNNFCPMKQPGGIGSRVIWGDPAEFAESMLGFKRYFTLENKICEALFKIAEKPPTEWTSLKIKIVRRDREQTVGGAVRSALLAAAFAIQAASMRAAANHVIQSSGAGLTKRLQRRIWDIQAAGVGSWRVIPMNIHDEIMTPCDPEYSDAITNVVQTFVTEHIPLVPLLAIDWSAKLGSWADK
jgi:hypothetical protein